jgi:hypothetical protein
MAPPSAGRRPAAGATKPAARRVPPAAGSEWLLLAALAAATLLVHRHTLQAFFALDDLILFQQAHGIREWPVTLWRWLSGWVWFRVVLPAWDTQPFPYHVTSLVLHAVNAVLLHQLARRWGAGPLASLIGAGLFALSRLHFPALLAITSIGELLALTGLLSALLLAGSPRRGAAAMVAIALALSAKESVLLVPFAVLFLGEPRGTLADRLRAHARLLGASVVLGGVLLAAGIASGRLGGAAYAVSFAENLLENVARLGGWSLDLVDPIPDLHAATEGSARVFLSLVCVGLSALALWRGTPLARAGVAWWWLAVAPVLPLPGRTYLHYLYVPLAGLALAASAFVEAGLRRRRRDAAAPGRLAWGVAVAGLLAYGVWSDVLLSLRIDLKMSGVDWPLDPVYRKSEIARRSITDVRSALRGSRAHVAILIPASISRDVDLGSGRVSADTRVRRYALADVLDEGRSLQALAPEVDSVAIVHDHEPGRWGWRYFLSRGDSHLVPLGTLPEAHARFVEAMLASGFPDAARDYAEKALAERPGDPALRALLERSGRAPAD